MLSRLLHRTHGNRYVANCPLSSLHRCASSSPMSGEEKIKPGDIVRLRSGEHNGKMGDVVRVSSSGSSLRSGRAVVRLFDGKMVGLTAPFDESMELAERNERKKERPAKESRAHLSKVEGKDEDDADNNWTKLKDFIWLAVGVLLRKPILKFFAASGVRLVAMGPMGKAAGASLLALVAFASVEDEPLPPPAVGRSKEHNVPIPSYWKNKDLLNLKVVRIIVDEEIRKEVESSLRRHSHSACTTTTGRARVLRVERIENMTLWKQYIHRKKEIVDFHRANRILAKPVDPAVPSIMRDVDGLLDANLNEFYLYHGTTSATAQIVANCGFDERVGTLAGLYGGAVYHACDACKSAMYAKESEVKCMIISRVCLGDPYYARGMLQNLRRPPDRGYSSGLTYDSVIGCADTTHREFMVYDRTSIYPEFIVFFKLE